MNQNDEIKYKIEVEPLVFELLNNLEKGSAAMGLAVGQFRRAVFTWAMVSLSGGPTPAWVWAELAAMQRENTTDGESAG